MIDLIKPNWSAPKNIKAFSTTRNGGQSKSPFDTLNLADHLEDNQNDVFQNRENLAKQLDVSLNNVWLTQTHSRDWLKMPSNQDKNTADASWTKQKKAVCCVMTADCVPVLICNKQGDFVAAVHAGWQGVFNGIIKNIKDIYPKTNELMAWIGPCIKQNAFEVDNDFYDDFIKQDVSWQQAFTKKEKWHFDMVKAATMQLQSAGITQVSGGDYCTHDDEEHFFSYRRNGLTGRIASLIWIE